MRAEVEEMDEEEMTQWMPQVSETFMDIGKKSENEIFWMIIIHVVFVGSGVLLALMDYISSKSKKN